MMMKDKITPNQLMLLCSLKNKISIPQINLKKDLDDLTEKKYIERIEKGVKTTDLGNLLITKYDNIFIKAKKKTNIQLMGKDFNKKLNEYRMLFPSGKLPSGKPARVNVKTLENGFRWFFENYDHTWEDILKATAQYVNEYEDKQYMYMKTSQYFLSKEDKSKIKTSELADYCDMLKEGFENKESYFKERIV
jgi:hypothetical protein